MPTIETTAHLRNLRMSPRKVRLLVDAIRGLRATEALIQLQFSGTLAAKPVAKLLQSAMANAEHNHAMTKESLIVSTAFVDGGPIMYRFTPRAMGRSAPIRKRTSHITIVLSGQTSGQTAEKKTKKEEESKRENEEKKQETGENAKSQAPKSKQNKISKSKTK